MVAVVERVQLVHRLLDELLPLGEDAVVQLWPHEATCRGLHGQRRTRERPRPPRMLQRPEARAGDTVGMRMSISSSPHFMLQNVVDDEEELDGAGWHQL